jgi:ATP-dependent helicase/nuclease subunit B
MSARELKALGEKHFAPLKDYEEARAFWWTRFVRIADWMAGWERERRADVSKIFAEVSGKHPIPLGKIEFVLTARADRIEQRSDGTFAILDYKTGQPPTDAQVRSGLAPQLTLEAAVLRNGGFAGIPAGASVSEISYVRPQGRRSTGRAEKTSRSATAHQTALPTTHFASSRASRKGFLSRANPTARSFTRCGKNSMATTIIWRV